MTSKSQPRPWMSVLLHPESWNVVFSANPAPARRLPGLTAARRVWSRAHSHRNPCRETLLCLEGNCFFGLDGRVYPCAPGSLFFIEANVPHDNYYPADTRAVELLWLRQLGDHLCLSWIRVQRGRLARVANRPTMLTQEQLGISLSAFPAATEPATTPPEQARLRLLTGLATTYLGGLCLAAEENGEKAHCGVEPRSRVVTAIRQHIDATAGNGVTLDFLAHFSGYSKYHMLRLFREHTGQTIHEYINYARAQRVAKLRETGMTAQAIAGELGFSSASAYLHWRRANGLTAPQPRKPETAGMSAPRNEAS